MSFFGSNAGTETSVPLVNSIVKHIVSLYPAHPATVSVDPLLGYAPDLVVNCNDGLVGC